LGAGKKNDMVTLHLAKVAPKMARLDAAPLRKRSAVRGEIVVDVKAGDALLGLTEGWTVERFVVVRKKEEVTKRAAGKKGAPKKANTTKKSSSAKKPMAKKK
jgi:hypothetical protein